jgi:hypothetical protein
MNLVKMRILPKLTVFTGLLALTGSAFAWNDTGHMVIAAIAEERLAPEVRAEAHRLVSIGATDRTNTFLTASAWADDARDRESAPWHYINFFFRDDGKEPQGKPEAENVVVAIERFSKVLADRMRPDEERAAALRYLIHFVGDVHQPLHAVARESDKHPTGDRGGNDFAIVPPASLATMPRPPQNLHVLWDLGAGLFPRIGRPLDGPREESVRRLAADLKMKHPPGAFDAELRIEDPMKWAKEGLEIARNVVYTLPEGSQPSAEYMRKAREVSGERAALAAYRLADLLNRLMKREERRD